MHLSERGTKLILKHKRTASKSSHSRSPVRNSILPKSMSPVPEVRNVSPYYKNKKKESPHRQKLESYKQSSRRDDKYTYSRASFDRLDSRRNDTSRTYIKTTEPATTEDNTLDVMKPVR